MTETTLEQLNKDWIEVRSKIEKLESDYKDNKRELEQQRFRLKYLAEKNGFVPDGTCWDDAVWVKGEE